ncbi:MAG TPA: GYD domain-containing protein [Terriglobia bacterium]|nr:GYD domain-containing protein [Terriglobia bacterium]
MAKYLLQATYSPEGIKGVVKDTATGRKAAIQKALAGVGAKVEAMYYAFGDYDAVLIIDAPDNVAAAAISFTTCATGLARIKTIPLLTIEETDQAVKKTVQYRGPGQ